MAKKRKNSNSTQKNWGRKFLFFLACAIVLLFTYEYFRPRIILFTKEKLHQIEVLAQPADPIASTQGLEIPARLTHVKEQIITHPAYTLSYNSDWKVPNWVAYELTAEETRETVKRKDSFKADPKLGRINNLTADYRASGYDRGHMAPCDDMSWSESTMLASFYYTNMSPQHPNLNRGVWKALEEQVRLWAVTDSAICIVAGNVVKGETKTLGDGEVVVPTHLYKAVLSPYVGRPKAIAFIFKNSRENGSYLEQAVTVDSLERWAGIDLFPALPDDREEAIESTLDLSLWE